LYAKVGPHEVIYVFEKVKLHLENIVVTAQDVEVGEVDEVTVIKKNLNSW